MRNLISALLLILAIAMAASAQTSKTDKKPDSKAKATAVCPGPNGLTADEIATILQEHNRMRTKKGLNKLTWSCTMADLAQTWATQSILAHREDVDVGENIFVASNPKISILTGMNSWEKERAFWDNTAGTCEAGKTCAHYTQMVWRATTQIGCGINRNAGGDSKWKTMMVCNYSPSGNTGGSAY